MSKPWEKKKKRTGKKMSEAQIKYAKALSKKKGWKYPSWLANSISMKRGKQWTIKTNTKKWKC